MFVRLKRTAKSFVVMVAVFWVYRLIAEPLIEPHVEEKRAHGRHAGRARGRGPETAKPLGGLHPIFSRGFVGAR